MRFTRSANRSNLATDMAIRQVARIEPCERQAIHLAAVTDVSSAAIDRARKSRLTGAMDRAMAVAIAFLSTASLALGAGRWLILLVTHTVPHSGGTPVLARMSVPANGGDPGDTGVLAQSGQAPGQPISLEVFLNNIQWVIFGLLATLTTTCLFIGFARWIAAQEPGEYEEAKRSLKNAAKGFIGALLSPTIVNVLQSLINGPGRR